VYGYVALDGNKGQRPVCQAKNVFEEKGDTYKMSNFKALSIETEKTYTSLILVRECDLIPGAEAVWTFM
jgi:hypothetical protein